MNSSIPATTYFYGGRPDADLALLMAYWGKAKPSVDGPASHPALYHCLDVAAVGYEWWRASAAVRRLFLHHFCCPTANVGQLKAWVMFFVALHDLGKIDLRFQRKAPAAFALPLGRTGMLTAGEVEGFDHGAAGMRHAHGEYAAWSAPDPERARWDVISPWMAAVAGHHGDYPTALSGQVLDVDEELLDQDRHARQTFVRQLADQFLTPEGLSLFDLPPRCSKPAQAALAGFCAICDWIASNHEEFPYRLGDVQPSSYFHARVREVGQTHMLARLGLVSSVMPYPGLSALLAERESPRGVQTLIDDLPLQPGLTIIEAPTGVGKTESGLALCWRLVHAGFADSIVFALPTQATANGMLPRLEKFGVRAFGDANVVLAHGKSALSPEFERLIAVGDARTAQRDGDAAAQCARWLANSRKRAFIGQVGTCTVDQVLLSVLPVRHKFVRGFGLNKSVLIVDEVHAYDAYMNGLLQEVLRRQAAAGGSAILMSATLPATTRRQLLDAWGSSSPLGGDAPYPVVWACGTANTTAISVALPPEHAPLPRVVKVERFASPGAYPDDTLLERIARAGESGARVAVIVNIVGVAQRLVRSLRQRATCPVDLFHARYRFRDRQSKERQALALYGREAERGTGRVLVATQVVEQSLDLDFDWMVSQICPVDLLFQRIGRLHRHDRARPAGFELPLCTVLTVDSPNDFGMHGKVYDNTRVLRRTDGLLTQHDEIAFPAAYRLWIESVYDESEWPGEGERVTGEFIAWRQAQAMREANASNLINMSRNQYRDEESKIAGLTRDSAQSLTLLPLLGPAALLDGVHLSLADERMLGEQLALNTVSVPATWQGFLQQRRAPHDTEGPLAFTYQIAMTRVGSAEWTGLNGAMRYSTEFGLERINLQ